MEILTQRQMKVLMLRSKGKKLAEIVKETGESWNSVDYAFKTGPKNLEDCVKIVEWAMKEHVLSYAQMLRLKKSLSKRHV